MSDADIIRGIMHDISTLEQANLDAHASFDAEILNLKTAVNMIWAFLHSGLPTRAKITQNGVTIPFNLPEDEAEEPENE